jgi:hypothetical protein
MRIIETEVFKFDELNEKAKEKARNWYQTNVACNDSDWFESVYETAQQAGKILGISFQEKRNSRSPAIWFNGFHSQGDGACFEGSYRYAKGSVKAIAKEYPQDKDLQAIAKELQAIQKRQFYNLYASTKHRGHYYHSGCMSVDVEHTEDRYRDIGNAEQDITDQLRLFADWIYDQLEKEYEYLSSDEQAEENIKANEYEFDINGNII